MTTPVPDPVVVPSPIPPAPIAPSITGEITLALTAVATVIAFIWHKDYSSLVPALGILATSVIGAALALESAVKHRTHAVAVSRYNAQLLDAHYALRAEPGALVTRSIS